jgi:hypothetical protein
MMKMMILAPRKVGMTPDEFRRYLLEIHGPLVKSVPEVAAGILHYHYNFPVYGAGDDAFGHPIAEYLDVVTQGWFQSRLGQHRNMAQPRYLTIIRPDEGRFADEGRAVMHYTHEIEITAGARTPHKIFYFRRRRAGLSRDEFQSRWRCAFTEIVAESPIWSEVVSRCIQNHVLPESDHPDGADPRFFDLMDELFLREPVSVGKLKSDPALLANLAALESELLDPARTLAIVTETIMNIP